ncbi:MAG: heterocyst frequency control protein PatD [Microcoleus sp. SIO2G3]|nr:heterocyst frequency control protein PatD [Microcoleus sp. SIO2G3]
MLQPSHHQRYQEFKQALEELHKTLVAKDSESVALHKQFQEVKQLFISEVANLSADEFAEDIMSRWQSIQTEIYKQMRLLETDLMLLQAARSAATTQTRTASVGDRISTLIRYCEALLEQ